MGRPTTKACLGTLAWAPMFAIDPVHSAGCFAIAANAIMGEHMHKTNESFGRDFQWKDMVTDTQS